MQICYTDTCLVKYGTLLKAKKLVVGDIGLFEDKYIINVRLIDVETDALETENSCTKTCTKSADALVQAMQFVTQELCGEIVSQDSSVGARPQQIIAGDKLPRYESEQNEIIGKDNVIPAPSVIPVPYQSTGQAPAGIYSDMVLIPAGEFTMGSDSGGSDEKPVHKVYLDAYYIDKYEVTFEQYDKFCEATGRTKPSDSGWGRGKRPVINVSWDDAVAYASWAGKRLPTEAEWEKAARGTDGRKYPWGNELPSADGRYRCNYDCYDGNDGNDHSIYKRDGYEYTASVGSYENGKSPYGCYDMAGNVWEWCSDWYDEGYYKVVAEQISAMNPQGPASGSYRVLRGGSWVSAGDGVRSAARDGVDPTNGVNLSGFRCASSSRP